MDKQTKQVILLLVLLLGGGGYAFYSFVLKDDGVTTTPALSSLPGVAAPASGVPPAAIPGLPGVTPPKTSDPEHRDPMPADELFAERPAKPFKRVKVDDKVRIVFEKDPLKYRMPAGIVEKGRNDIGQQLQKWRLTGTFITEENPKSKANQVFFDGLEPLRVDDPLGDSEFFIDEIHSDQVVVRDLSRTIRETIYFPTPGMKKVQSLAD